MKLNKFGKTKYSRFFIISLIVLLILADALFFQKGSDLRTFPIMIIYVFFIIRFQFKSNTTFFICLFLFLLIYMHFVFSPPTLYDSQYPLVPFGEKLAVWLYLLLVVGVIQKWRE